MDTFEGGRSVVEHLINVNFVVRTKRIDFHAGVQINGIYGVQYAIPELVEIIWFGDATAVISVFDHHYLSVSFSAWFFESNVTVGLLFRNYVNILRSASATSSASPGSRATGLTYNSSP